MIHRLEEPKYTFIGTLELPFNHTYTCYKEDYIPFIKEWLMNVVGITFDKVVDELMTSVWYTTRDNVYTQGIYNEKKCNICFHCLDNQSKSNGNLGGCDTISVGIKTKNCELIKVKD